MKLPLKVVEFYSSGKRIGIQDADGRFIGEKCAESSFRSFSTEEAEEIVRCVNQARDMMLIEKERNRLIRWQQLAIEARPGIELEIDLPSIYE